jgi:hypothetical protein
MFKKGDINNINGKVDNSEFEKELNEKLKDNNSEEIILNNNKQNNMKDVQLAELSK